ncbi:MAG TPA: prepilin-type N-terminal cleavage/methylation domain-containing protein, partial [Candidatus Ozemobacteraceae bacterium]|nr:prepilin-type N-terminal cleavage/methylation domain-containing protein [Candidatus Ozemobacteraceae bacterium]
MNQRSREYKMSRAGWAMKRGKRAFTLVELLVAGAIFILIMTLAYRMNVASTQKTLTGKLVLQ